MKTIPVLVAFLIASVGPASGAPAARADADPEWAAVLSAECLRFAPPRDPEHPMYWDLRLSLATCVQDVSFMRTESPFDVDGLVSELSLRLGPAMLIWRDALDHAPPVVQVRAAYQVGAAAVALLTRCRGSLAAPAHFSKADATARERLLRARLEPLLAPTRNVAWSAFTVIDNIAREVPELEDDPVHRSMVRSARMNLRVLEPPSGTEPRLVRAVRAID